MEPENRIVLDRSAGELEAGPPRQAHPSDNFGQVRQGRADAEVAAEPATPAAKPAAAPAGNASPPGGSREAEREIAALREQLAALGEELKLARNEISMLQMAMRAQRSAMAAGRPPKPPPKPIDPDTELGRIKIKMNRMRERHEEAAQLKGYMSAKTVGLISKALHSDNGTPSAEQREEAFKAFNAWKADNKKAAKGGKS